jgi:hypothetical protein
MANTTNAYNTPKSDSVWGGYYFIPKLEIPAFYFYRAKSSFQIAEATRRSELYSE